MILFFKLCAFFFSRNYVASCEKDEKSTKASNFEHLNLTISLRCTILFSRASSQRCETHDCIKRIATWALEDFIKRLTLNTINLQIITFCFCLLFCFMESGLYDVGII